eukprot:Pgem_evm1s4008
MSDRFEGRRSGQKYFTSIDSVDFLINESHSFDAALRYEVVLSVNTGKIVWVYGGFAAGSWHGLRIAQSNFIHLLGPHEQSIADKRYNDGCQNFFTETYCKQSPRKRRILKRLLARHKT